ncbi:hypothetical protein L211DRAFT_535289 [Terfezia boudieri ATCC MYA-4762]|uniref:Uncharacterized protein n=1 Tax=Terfezia boudieri ATCC MYA-4762 TaxID=1051890 RepID=A0A3N4LWR6_9PEZI|nr:hypothetical protein L211DRAFT_535289 [Terfezia boudieri ATCC MYA-4762]
MLVTNIFLYHKKIGKYGINSEKLRNSIMNMTGAYKRQINRYTEVQGPESQEEEPGSSERTQKVSDPAMNFKSFDTFFLTVELGECKTSVCAKASSGVTGGGIAHGVLFGIGSYGLTFTF